MSGLSLLLLSRCLRKDERKDDKERGLEEGSGGEGADISLLGGSVSKRWLRQ